MKKFYITILAIISLNFTSCYIQPAKSRLTSQEYDKTISSSFAIDLRPLDGYLWVDTWTDVLYCKTGDTIIAVMKPDGSCLTYSEFIKRYEENKWNVN